MSILARIEVMTNYAAAGGVRLATLAGLVSVVERRELSREDQLTVQVVPNTAGTEALKNRRVLRLLNTDGSYDEWRIVRSKVSREGGTNTVLTAKAPTLELTDRAVVRRVEADGSTAHRFDAPGLTLAEHLTYYLLPSLAAAGQPWWSAGVVEGTRRIASFSYDSSTVAESLSRLAEAVTTTAGTGTEWRIRRLGETGYAIDFLQQIGYGAPVLDVRYGKNMLSESREVSDASQATRIYGLGADDGDGIRSDMSRARFRITALDTPALAVTLDDGYGGPGPIGADDQLNGKRLLLPDGSATALIADSVRATQVITLPSLALLAVGQMVGFVEANSQPVLYLDDPAMVAEYDVKHAVFDRPDLPPTVNLVPNGDLRDWPSANPAPTGWNVNLAQVTVTRRTDPLHTRVGGVSMRMQVNYPGAGAAIPFPIAPTSKHPYFSGFASLLVRTGRARVELLFNDGSIETVRPSGTDAVAHTGDQRNQWLDIGLAGVDAYKLGAVLAAVRVVQDGAEALDCDLDAAQMTQTPYQQPFMHGNGATALWQAVNERLRLYAPPDVALAALVVDPDAYAYDQATIGGRIALTDPELGVIASTRLVGWQRERTDRLAMKVDLSSLPADVIDALARPVRPAPLVHQADTRVDPSITAFISDVPSSPGSSRVQLAAQPVDANVFYLVLDLEDPVPPMGDGAWLPYTGPITVSQTGDPPKIVAYAQIEGKTSPVGTWKLDANALADVTLSLAENPAGTMPIDWVPDLDTVLVDVYARVNNAGAVLGGAGQGYPTVNGLVTDQLDVTKWLGRWPVNPHGVGQLANGTPVPGGTHYYVAGLTAGQEVGVAVVGTSRTGRVSAPVFARRVIAGLVSPALTAFSFAQLNEGAPDTADLTWTANSAVTSGMALRLYLSVDGGGWSEVAIVSNPAAVAGTQITLTGYHHSTDKFAPLVSFRFMAELRTGATIHASYISETLTDTVQAGV